MRIVGDNSHEIPNPIFEKKNKKNIILVPEDFTKRMLKANTRTILTLFE